MIYIYHIYLHHIINFIQNYFDNIMDNTHEIINQNLERHDFNKGRMSFQIQIPQRSVQPSSKHSQRKGSYIPSHQTFVTPNKRWKIFGLMMIVCISPFFVGVTIFLSVAASFLTYQRYYGLRSYPVLAFSALNACVPLGGVIGSLTFPMLIRNAGKMNIAFVNFILAIVFCGITLIPYYWVMIFGRFLLGIICSWYNTLAAILIKDMTPLQYRAIYGGLFFTARASGITFSIIIGYIFYWDLDNLTFIMINIIPIFIAFLQWILLKIFVKQNPADLARFNQAGLKPYFTNLYAQKDVDKAVQNCLREFKTMEAFHTYIHKGRGQTEKEQATKIYDGILKKILVVSLQVSAVRQLSGINYITPYAQQAFQALKIPHTASGPILVNFVQILSTFLGIFLCHKFGRRPLLLLGIAGAFISTFIMALTNYFQNYTGVLASIVMFMIFAGAMLEPVAWPYAPDLLLIVKIPLSNVASWASASIVASLPVVPNSYPYFFFFSGFLLVNLIILYFTAIQIKDLTTRELITGFMKQAYEQVQIKFPNIAKKNKRRTTRIHNPSRKRTTKILDPQLKKVHHHHHHHHHEQKRVSKIPTPTPAPPNEQTLGQNLLNKIETLKKNVNGYELKTIQEEK